MTQLNRHPKSTYEITFFASSFAKYDWPESPHCPAIKSWGGSDQRDLLVLGSFFVFFDHTVEPSSCISNYFIAILILPARLKKQAKALFNQRIFGNRKGEPHCGKKLFHFQFFANIFKVRWGEAYMLLLSPDMMQDDPCEPVLASPIISLFFFLKSYNIESSVANLPLSRFWYRSLSSYIPVNDY